MFEKFDTSDQTYYIIFSINKTAAQQRKETTRKKKSISNAKNK